MSKVKETKRTAVAIEKLHSLVKKTEYYYCNTPIWREIQQEMKYIEDHLIELSTDRKVDHARLASKLKSIFFKENKELKKENKELKHEIEELKDDQEIEISQREK